VARIRRLSLSGDRRPLEVNQNANLGRAATEITAAAPPVALRPDLGQVHIFGLQAFRPLLHFKGYARTLVERFISASRNRGKMDKHIFATFALDKSKSFGGVKPLHCSGFFQDDSFCDLTLTYRLREAQLLGIRDSKAGPSEFKGCTRMITFSSLTLRPRDGSISTASCARGLARDCPSQADLPVPESSGSSPRAGASGVSQASEFPALGEPIP